MPDTVACEHCSGDTEFTTEMQPLGDQPGHRVYQCAACGRYTWKTWRTGQQQQQPQPQKKE